MSGYRVRAGRVAAQRSLTRPPTPLPIGISHRQRGLVCAPPPPTAEVQLVTTVWSETEQIGSGAAPQGSKGLGCPAKISVVVTERRG